MEFRILGPLEVWDEGRRISLSGPKQRALLALLLLHANEVVAGDRLIEELWGGDSTESTAAALRVTISRLRKALPHDVLVTRSPGYTIRLDPDQLDLRRFERLVDEGRGLLGRRQAGRRGGAAARGAVALAGPAARGLRLRELRPGRDREARGGPPGRARASDRGGSSRSVATAS